MAKRGKRGLPSREEIVDFIATSPTPVGKREIARAFKVDPGHRVALKGLIKDIERSGEVERGAKRRLAPVGATARGRRARDRRHRSRRRGRSAKPVVMACRPRPSPRIVMRRDRLGAEEVGQRVVARARAAARTGGDATRRASSACSPARPSACSASSAVTARGRPHRADRPPQQERIPRRALPTAREAAERRARPRRGAAGAPPRPAAGAHHRAHRRHREPATISLHRHPRARHSRPSFRREALAQAEAAKPVDARPAGRSARSRWSPSTAATRAISTTRSGPSPTPTRPIPAAGTSSSPSPMSPVCAAGRCARPRGASSAATRSISPTASCRCCRRRSPTSCAR